MKKEMMSWDEAIAHVMKATGKNRRQATAALIEAQDQLRRTPMKRKKLSDHELCDLEDLMTERILDAFGGVIQLVDDPRQRVGLMINAATTVFSGTVLELRRAYDEDTGKKLSKRNAIVLLAMECLNEADPTQDWTSLKEKTG